MNDFNYVADLITKFLKIRPMHEDELRALTKLQDEINSNKALMELIVSKKIDVSYVGDEMFLSSVSNALDPLA